MTNDRTHQPTARPEPGARAGGAAVVIPLVSTPCSSWTQGSSWRFLAPANHLLAALLPAPGLGCLLI